MLLQVGRARAENRALVELPPSKRIHHAYAYIALKPLMPILLLAGKNCQQGRKLLRDLLDLIAGGWK